MNKILKRLLSVVLALVMVVTLVPLSKPVTVEAAEPADTYFYVQTDMVDYFNDSRVGHDDSEQYRYDNQGLWTGADNAPYGKLNGWISGLNGFSNPNSDSNYPSGQEPTPLYFGDLYHPSQAGTFNNNLTWFWKGANVAFGGTNNGSVVASGIVADNLSDDGELLASWSTDNNKIVMPYFDEVYTGQSQSNYMKFYNNLQFPFTASTQNGVTTYSFDSEKNTVYYDYSTGRLVRDDSFKIYDWGNNSDGQKAHAHQNKVGFFPFNSTNYASASEANALNFGFGTKFTIPFTVPADGLDTNDDPITFNFTGDDDVWVYIDGALVLDMGGAHFKASGTIDFANKTATVTTGSASARTANNSGSVQEGNATPSNVSYDAVSFSNITVKTPDGNTTDLASYINDGGVQRVHTLTMYYMERGMWNSNMSINFNFTPVPSGMTLSKTVDTTNVNAGLQDEVETLDDFDFSIQTKDLKTEGAQYSPLQNFGYTLYEGDGNSTLISSAEDDTVTINSSQYAANFVKSDGDDAFYGGTGIQITEGNPSNNGAKLQYDITKTKWAVYDSATSATPETQGTGMTAEFNLGDKDSGDFDRYTKHVNFTNVPQIGTVQVTKEWNGEVPDSLAETDFNFKVEVSLPGASEYKTYALSYTSDKDGEGNTNADGTFTIKPNEKITFAGIPAGAEVRITETTTSGDSWQVSGDSVKTVEVTADNTVTATITNETSTTNVQKVIYVEAGKTTAYTPSDVTITSADLTSSQTDGAEAEPNETTPRQLDITAPNANEAYIYDIEGSTSDGKKLDDQSTLTVYTYKATDKVYVFDYGLESDLTQKNENHDGLFEEGVFYNVNATGDYETSATLGEVKGAEGNSQTKITPAENVAIKTDGSSDGAVTFKPVAFMDKAENYTYTANIVKKDATFSSSDPETGTVVNGTIEVMPANVVYYEDNFNSDAESTDSAVKIIYSGTNAPTGTSLELTQSNGQTEQYGHDDAYASGTTDSAGSSTALTADGYNTKAEFTFTGSGFDVVARTTTETAGIIYMIQKYDSDGGTWSDVKFGAVDTYYANGDLYQIPVIHEELGETAKYKVTLSVKSTGQGSVVYLDGIRIYNPMGTSGDTEYIDNEEGVTFEKISDLIIGNGEITETGDGFGITGQTIDGSRAALLSNYFEDGYTEALGYTKTEDMTEDAAGSNQTNSILQYMHSGPNNEIYLDGSASIAFVAEGEISNNSTLQIEAKLVNIDGQRGDISSCEGLDLNVWNGTRLVKADTVSSSTAMYYTIDLNDCISLGDNKYLVVISGNSDVDDAGTTSLSFSNLKYKGYTLSNPLDEQYERAIEGLIDTSWLPGSEVFVDYTGTYTIRRNQWINYKYKVTLSRDVFEGGDPEFTMYYTNYEDEEEITVTAERVEGSDTEYLLRFRAPNAVGTFPIEIHYVTDGEESDEYLASSMKVNR